MHERMRHLVAWRDAPFLYLNNFICHKSAEQLDSMADKPSDPGSESVCRGTIPCQGNT